MKDLSAVRKATDAPLLVAALFALAFALFLPYSFHMHSDLHNNPTAYVNAGEMLCDRTKTPPNLILYPDTVGYDGQFYYRLALNPFTTRQIDFGMKIDDPPYRQQRILYPLLVWAVSGGQWQAVPWAMLFVNWACLVMMGWMAGRLMQSFGQHALWGALLVMYPGFVITYRFDLTEIVAATFLMASLLTLQRCRFPLTALLLVLAVLARETTLLFAFALLANNLYARYRRQALPIPDYCWIMPLVADSVWQFTLLRVWGHLPSVAGRQNFGVPIIGMIQYFSHLLQNLRLQQTHAIDRQDVYFIFDFSFR